MWSRAAVLTLVFGLAVAPTARAQSRLTGADLRGTVRDQTAASAAKKVRTAARFLM